MAKAKINSREHLAQVAAAKLAAGRNLSIEEWCALHRLSKATYFVHQQLGRGPKVVQVVPRGRVEITPEANRAWEQRFSKPSTEQAA